MGQVYEAIDGRLREFVLNQPVFFVATAPSGSDGHINVSPKGLSGTLAVLDERRVAYLDYYGSGVETIAHLRDNGRVVLMWCAFSGPPKIVRFHGTGTAVLVDDAEFEALWANFDGQIRTGPLARSVTPATRPVRRHGVRAIVVVEVSRISDSCGYGVPLLEHVGDRDLLHRSHERKDDAALAAYATTKNATSVDGLPGLASASPATAG
jgi:hypothetical protein